MPADNQPWVYRLFTFRKRLLSVDLHHATEGKSRMGGSYFIWYDGLDWDQRRIPGLCL